MDPEENNTMETSSEIDSSTDNDWLAPEARAALDFDPFAVPSTDEQEETASTEENGSPSAEGEGQAPQPASPNSAEVQQDGDTVEAQPEQPAPQSQAPLTPEQIAALQAQNAQLLNAVQAGQQPQGGQTHQPQGGNQQQPAQQADPLTAVPDYAFTIPDELVASLNSEDPAERKQALGVTIQSVARTIHQQVGQQFAAQMQRMVQQLPQVINQQVEARQTAKNVETDFYGKYPALNQPHLKMVVGQVAAEVMRTTGQTQWTPELRDAIGLRVIQSLQGVMPQVAAQPAPAAQPVMFGNTGSAAGNPRAAQRPGPKTQADHIADLF